MYSNILIGLNESAEALRALRRAIHLAATFHATLTAVAVTPSLPLYAAYAAALGADTHQIMEDDQHASFAKLLEMARTEANQHDIKLETVLSSGRVTDSLLEAVRANHIDLLVFGIHPGHGIRGFLLSGTAHELAEGARCDVLGVH